MDTTKNEKKEGDEVKKQVDQESIFSKNIKRSKSYISPLFYPIYFGLLKTKRSKRTNFELLI